MIVVPFEPYNSPKKQYCVRFRDDVHFTRDGQPGILLQDALENRLAELNNPDDVVFAGTAMKIAYIVQVCGYPRLKIQKYARSRSRGYTLAKVAQQVAQVMSDFLEKCETALGSGPLRFGNDYINLAHLYLLAVKQVSEGSYQPIFGVRRDEIPDDAVLDSSIFAENDVTSTKSQVGAPSSVGAQPPAGPSEVTTRYAYRCDADCPLCTPFVDGLISAWGDIDLPLINLPGHSMESSSGALDPAGFLRHDDAVN